MDVMSQIELYTMLGGRKVVSEGCYTDLSQRRAQEASVADGAADVKASKGFPLSLQSLIADLPAADVLGKKKQTDSILQVRKCLNCGFPAAG